MYTCKSLAVLGPQDAEQAQELPALPRLSLHQPAHRVSGDACLARSMTAHSLAGQCPLKAIAISMALWNDVF